MMTELEIPWIIAGPGLARRREIADPINTYDTAAIVAHLPGLRAPDCWIARPTMASLANPPRAR